MYSYQAREFRLSSLVTKQVGAKLILGRPDSDVSQTNVRLEGILLIFVTYRCVSRKC